MGNFISDNFAMVQAIPPEQLWMVIVGFIIAFVLAFGIGANDVANSFGTSVGSRVLTLKQAFVLACIFEMLGAVLLGAKVSDTIRKGIIDIEPYANNSALLMAGNVAALSGSCVWLIAATLLRLPVSATHSIVGSTVGFALVAHGARGIHWWKLAMIVGSWFISPILAGGVSVALFFLCRQFILSKPSPLEPGLRLLPVFYAVTIVVNVFSVFFDGPPMLGFDRIPVWGTFIISFGAGIICAIIIRVYVVPWQRRKIKAEVCKSSTNSSISEDPNTALPGNAEALDDAVFETNTNGNAATNHIHADNHKPHHNHHHHHHSHHRHSADVAVDEKDAFTALTIVTANNTALVLNDLDSKTWISRDRMRSLSTSSKSAPVEVKPLIPTNNVDPESKLPNAAGPNGGAETVAIQQPDEIKTGPEETAFEKGRMAIKDEPETARLFSFLQILTAVFGAFAHGGNDVSNAIGPLVSLWLIGSTGIVATKALTPIWILMYGGVGISVGLIVLGRRVIKTIGEDLARVTPSSGFCIEIGSALTVLIASNVGIPISTTHCKVGSVVFVGRFRARENVDWSIFRNIVIAWLVTLPISGGISAAIMAGLMLAVPH